MAKKTSKKKTGSDGKTPGQRATDPEISFDDDPPAPPTEEGSNQSVVPPDQTPEGETAPDEGGEESQAASTSSSSTAVAGDPPPSADEGPSQGEIGPSAASESVSESGEEAPLPSPADMAPPNSFENAEETEESEDLPVPEASKQVQLTPSIDQIKASVKKTPAPATGQKDPRSQMEKTSQPAPKPGVAPTFTGVQKKMMVQKSNLGPNPPAQNVGSTTVEARLYALEVRVAALETENKKLKKRGRGSRTMVGD